LSPARSNKAETISRCLELAILLESSAHKPGNISIVTDFEDTKYGHFLASAVAAAKHFRRAAENGEKASRKEIEVSSVGIGGIIKDCVKDINAWQHGGNTILGTVMLLTPIACAAGMTQIPSDSFDVNALRSGLKLIVEATTPEDAVDVYEAINLANPSGLGEVSDLDVNDPRSKERILKEKISLFEIFRSAAAYDGVSAEWVNNYALSLDVAYPQLKADLAGKSQIGNAIVNTFLKVLADHPDTLIARKAGVQKAKEISSEAEGLLKFDIESLKGKERLKQFDAELRSMGNILNPGTTADIVCAGLSVLVLGGYRP
jgi:triphosphoribosyl-dephospho-CoA synthase